ncbi:UTRA domain-containing protein [Kribbella amoyensis]|uniref:UTRA domain-containing protein n=1 Tax=Kribbella amoyensis TaxID=996641 RepID=UPI001EE2AF2B|nr:UTRA domain-containing protein [Kribbella amoyensis]
MTPQPVAVRELPDERREPLKPILRGRLIPRLEPVQRHPPRRQRQPGHQLAQPRPGLEELDFAEQSLYDELTVRWGVTLGLVSASIIAAPPDTPEDAALLAIDPTTPCLVITSAPRTASNEVLLHAMS